MTAREMAKKRWKGTTKAERVAHAERVGKLGGRPKKIVECKLGCGASGGVVEMRKHRCSQERQ